MDETELNWYLAQVFGTEYEEESIIEQLCDEEGYVPGCYRVAPAKGYE